MAVCILIVAILVGVDTIGVRVAAIYIWEIALLVCVEPIFVNPLPTGILVVACCIVRDFVCSCKLRTAQSDQIAGLSSHPGLSVCVTMQAGIN